MVVVATRAKISQLWAQKGKTTIFGYMSRSDHSQDPTVSKPIQNPNSHDMCSRDPATLKDDSLVKLRTAEKGEN